MFDTCEVQLDGRQLAVELGEEPGHTRGAEGDDVLLQEGYLCQEIRLLLEVCLHIWASHAGQVHTTFLENSPHPFSLTVGKGH